MENKAKEFPKYLGLGRRQSVFMQMRGMICLLSWNLQLHVTDAAFHAHINNGHAAANWSFTKLTSLNHF